MIVYQNSKEAFIDDVLSNTIERIILDAYKLKLKSNVNISEVRSWKNSLQYMNNVLQDVQIPDDCNISIEYKIPQTSNRIDFIITGQNESNQDHALIIELKQWETAEITEKDAVVKTFLGKSTKERPHPSIKPGLIQLC